MTQKELGYVELEWTCKRCGTVNPGMQRVCTNCGAPIGQDDQFELPDQQTLITDQDKLAEAKAGPAIQCPYCNVYNPADAKICKQCGGDIEAGLARQAGQVLGAFQTAAVPEKPCPYCNQPVKTGASRCPHCGGDLLVTAKPTSTAAVLPKKAPRWITWGGVGLGLILIAALIAFVVTKSRREDVTASVADVRWQLSVEILALQPVQRSDWSEQVPSGATDISCRDKFKETSDSLVANATEECGTPYTIDTGSGAGKVAQDCVYQVYASYCDYTVQELSVVNTAVAAGADTNPYWPGFSLQSGQQEGNRYEQYQVTFDSGQQTYTYSPPDGAEFGQFTPGSQWLLSVNGFGNVDVIGQK
jgi:DNA-directed RNA polymerase subunit RPC12/RpoP